MTLNLPAGYFHAQMLFGGVAAPTKAACTFAGKDEAVTSTPATIGAAIITAYNARLDIQTNSSITFEGVRVKKGPMDIGPYATVAASNAGGNGVIATTPNVAFLLHKYTAIGGKKGQGRMYWPGVGESEVDYAGAVDATKLSTFNTALGQFFADLATAGYPMYLAHSFGTYKKRDGSTVVVASRAPDLVTSIALDAKAATQRRRLRR